MRWINHDNTVRRQITLSNELFMRHRQRACHIFWHKWNLIRTHNIYVITNVIKYDFLEVNFTASQQLQHAVCNCPVTALWCLTVSSNLCVRLSFQSSCRGDAAPHRPPPLWRGSETWGSRWALLPGGRQPEGDHRVVTKWPTSGHIRGTWTDAANCFVWGESLLPERRRRQERSVPWGCLRLCGPEQCRQGHQP